MYVVWKVSRLAGVVNRCCCTVAEYQLPDRNSHLQGRRLQRSAADCLAMAQKTYTRNMPLDRMLWAHGLSSDCLAAAAVADVDMVAVSANSGLVVGSSMAAPKLHAVALR